MFPSCVQEPAILERDRNRFEWLLEQLLLRNGCLAHLKVKASFDEGILNINITRLFKKANKKRIIFTVVGRYAYKNNSKN